LGASLEVLSAYIFLTFGEKLYYPLIPKQIISKYSALKGPPTETVMFRYFAFKGAPNSDCNLKVICFQRGPQPPLKCVSTLLSNFIEGAPKRN